MADSNQEKQDQSSSSIGEDSNAMTIEFLRARLLSERSVSKSARQRANELEKRVEELEEQLRIVSLQRKRAERATVDVLSILESRGMSDDPSEAFDSGSDDDDRETNRESEEGNGEEEQCIVSKRRIDSGSDDLDSSPIGSRSLSWKGRTGSQRSCEKHRDPFMRRPRNAASSSPKHHLGKSCRQIRRRDTRMVVERKADQAKFDSQENGVPSQSNGVPNCLNSTTEIVREGSESAGNERNAANRLDVNGHMLVKDMEKALEDQAQLIDQYEEMEKAQREWEEKFRENNISQPEQDSYDPGIQSDVTEEREEVKAQTPSNIGTNISETGEAKAEQVNVPTEPPKSQSNGFVPTLQVDIGDPTGQTSSSLNSIPSRFQSQEFAFPTAKQNSPENHNSRSPQNFHHSPHFNQSLERPSSETGSSSHKRDHSGSQNDLYALVPHNPHNNLDNVLDALKQAKSQLHRKMNQPSLKVTSGSFHTAIQPLPPRAEISVGCAGIFRLPTDFVAEEASARANFTSSPFISSLPPYYPGNGVSVVSTPDRFPASPEIERRPVLSSRFDPYSGPRSSSSLNSRFDPYPYSDHGLSPANRYNNYSPQPSYPPSPDVGFPSNGAAAASSFGMPEDRMPFYSDHGRPNNMYR